MKLVGLMYSKFTIFGIICGTIYDIGGTWNGHIYITIFVILYGKIYGKICSSIHILLHDRQIVQHESRSFEKYIITEIILT